MGPYRSLLAATFAVVAALAVAAPALAADTIAPTAVITAPAHAEPGVAIALSGSTSFDAAPGKVVSYRWKVDSGSTVVTSDPAFTAPAQAPGLHTVSLIVVDDSGNQSAADTAHVMVSDTLAPTAVLGVPSGLVAPAAAIALTAGKSTDIAPGTIVSYRWTVAGRPPVVTSSPTFNAPGVAFGPVSVSLVVVDDSGNASSPDTKTVMIADQVAPTAVLEGPASAFPGAPLALVGSKSFDVGGSVVSYRWSVGGRPVVVTSTPTFTTPGLGAGTYTVSLVVTDDSGNESAPDSHQVVVGDSVAPTAVLEGPATAAAGAPIALVGSKSFDVGGSVVSYRWSVGNRPVVVTSTPTFTVPGLTAGGYAVSLVVVDDSGNQSSADTHQLIVTDTTNPTPVLDVPGSVNAGATIHLSALKSFDVGGQIAQYRWTVGGRAAVVTTGPTFDAPGVSSGPVTVSLAVVDDSGNVSSATSATVGVVPPERIVTTFGRALLIAPVGQTRSQIRRGARTLVAGRIYAPVATRLTAAFSLIAPRSHHRLALGHTTIRIPAGGVQRLAIHLSRRALAALGGHRGVAVRMVVTTRAGTGAATTPTRTVTFAVGA